MSGPDSGGVSELCPDTISIYPSSVPIHMFLSCPRFHFVYASNVLCFRLFTIVGTLVPTCMSSLCYHIHFVVCSGSSLQTILLHSYLRLDPDFHLDLNTLCFPCHMTSLDMFLVECCFLICSLFDVHTMFLLVLCFVSRLHILLSHLCFSCFSIHTSHTPTHS